MRPHVIRLVAGIALAGSAPAVASAGGGNLIRNGGGEQGTAASDDASVVVPAGWTTTGSFTALLYVEPGATILGSIGTAVSDAINGGKILFAGGPNNAASSATQTVVFPASALKAVAAGRAKAKASAALGGWEGQADAASVTYQWLAASGKVIGSVVKLGPVTPAQRGNVTKLIPVSKTVPVPSAARSVRVTISAVAGGGYNDGYADNVSLILVT